MKLHKKRFSKKTILISAVAFVVLLASGAYAFVALNQSADYGSDRDTGGSAETDSKRNQIEEDTANDDNTNLPAKEGRSATINDDAPDRRSKGEDTASQKIETPRLERAGQSGSNIKVVASFQNTSNGVCKLELNQGSRNLKETASIVTGPSYYTCSFSIPVAKLAQDGSWQLTVTHESNSAVASSDTRTIEVTK